MLSHSATTIFRVIPRPVCCRRRPSFICLLFCFQGTLLSHDELKLCFVGVGRMQVCKKQYSSNLHAGNKGNPFSSTWWKNLKHRLTLECNPGEFVSSVEKV